MMNIQKLSNKYFNEIYKGLEKNANYTIAKAEQLQDLRLQL